MAITTQMDETFADYLANPQMKWCRARLLNAFANAAKQGVLDEVIDELLDDDDGETKERLLAALVRSGWIKSPDDRLVP